MPILDPTPPDQLLRLKAPSGKPYESRLNDVTVARQINTKATFADQGRSRIRALTKGMLDGNPPYSNAERQKYGLKWTANLNFMQAEAAVDSARVPYYDIITGAPTLTDCCTGYAMDDPDWSTWNQKITKHFDWLLKQWDQFYTETWGEQYWMLVEGWGVNLFDETGWKWRCLPPQCVKVPPRSKAALSDRLPWIIVKLNYTLTELWEMIQNEAAAEALGYDVELMKQVIMRSTNTMGPGNTAWVDQPWEEWQRRLRSNDIEAGINAEEVTICHLFLKEFIKTGQDKNISHFMFTENPIYVNSDVPANGAPDDFLRKSLNKFRKYSEALNISFQNTADTYWHSVRGMAQKGFKAWDSSNRLKCKAIDNAFLSSMLIIDPMEQTDSDKLQLTVKSDITILPPGTKIQQLQQTGTIEGALAVDRMITNMNAENLGVFNQRTISRDDGRGEMPTATQVELQANKEANLTTGQMGLYYLGRDDLYTTAFNKAVGSSDPDAEEFKRRCEADDIPPEALKQMEYVRCNRQAGYGSSQMKKMNISAMMQVAGMLPEDGKNNLLDDYISAYGGIEKIERWNPKIQLPTPDDGWATFENSAMHEGEEPVMISGQNDVKHLQIHFADAHETLDPLAQGVDNEQPDPDGIADAVPYVRVLIPHVEAHIARLAADPSRKQLAKYFELELKSLVSFSNKMFLVLRDVQRQNQLAQMEGQQANALGALDQVKYASAVQKMQIDRQKAAQKERQNTMKLAGNEQRANIKLIADLERDRVMTLSTLQNDRIKASKKTNGSS